MRFKSLSLVSLLFVVGCDTIQDTDDGPDRAEPRVVGMKRFESEAEFQQYFSAQVADFTDVTAVRGDDAVLETDGAAPPAAPSADAAADADGGSTAGYSTTTQQEAGVQEGDLVKNDANYIYVLSNGSLRIVQAGAGDALRELASVELEGWGQELYLDGDRVVALTRPESFFAYPMPARETGDALIAPEPYYYRPTLRVTVIDVTDRSLPAVQSTSTFEGDLHSSRMIDGTLHLVMVNYPDFFAPFIDLRGGAAVMTEASTADILPSFEIQIGDAEPVEGDVVEVTDVYHPISPDGYGMTTVISLNIADPASFRAVGVVAYPGNTYVSTEALYLTNSEFVYVSGSTETTGISKFAFTDAGPTLVAVGEVPGRVLNQYSMSEHEGYLRVATTIQNFDFTAAVPPPPTNNVYVLGQQGEDLSVVGSVENLAPGETIYSARFYGDKGYLVTFEQVDPLFTLDLADPASPKAVGELKVPGFSTFIVQMDASHLLTVGQDVRLEGGRVIPNGIQLSVFDVSDFANPSLVASQNVAGPNAWSEALYNPKALTFLPGENLVALPVEIYDYSFVEAVPEPGVIEDAPPPADDGTVVVEPTEVDAVGTADGEAGAEADVATPTDSFRGVYVYRVDAAAGFQFLGRMSSVIDTTYYYYSSFTRGVFIGENVFGVTDLGVAGAPKTAIVEASPWRVAFPLPEPVIPDEVFPVDVDVAVGGGTTGSAGIAE